MNSAVHPDLSTATWRKSTRSSGGGSNCVQVAHLPGHIAIRDSKNPEGPALIVTPTAFQELADRMRHGTFNVRPR